MNHSYCLIYLFTVWISLNIKPVSPNNETTYETTANSTRDNTSTPSTTYNMVSLSKYSGATSTTSTTSQDDIKCREEGFIFTGAVCGILALVFSTVTMILFCCSREIRKLKSKFLDCFVIDKIACCFNTKHNVNDIPFYYQVEAPQTVCQQQSISPVHENKRDSNKQAGSSIDNASVSDIYVNQDVIPDTKNRKSSITKWVEPNQQQYDMEILENDLYESTESLPSIKQEINTSEK
ncbi:hypothetical protein SNE40_018660 [Patella caerulea]|uniref:Uncharacterized protein n=1 Tax=Patella caerulea TaxID=87958 RepID=A0AAN8J6S4_PATCE